MSDAEYEDYLCQEFIRSDGKINPIDKRRLVYGKGPYLGYIALCKAYGYDVNNLLSEERTFQYNSGLRSPSRSPTRSPTRSPVRTIPLRPTVSTVSPVRPTVSGSTSISPLRSTQPISITPLPRTVSPVEITSFSEQVVQPAPPLTPQRSLTVRTAPNLSIPTVRGPSIQAQYSERVEQIGDERFDPDPVTTVTETRSAPVRTTVRGPYGPGGSMVTTTGVYKPPAQRQYTTYDYPEHPVQSVGNRVVNSNSVRPVYNTRTINVGEEEFDPDPITTVVEEPGLSIRDEVYGPYGPNGEMIRTTGVHNLPGTRRYITTDIPNHSVRTNSNTYSASYSDNDYY